MDSEGTDGTEHRDLSGPLPLQLEQLSQNKTNTTVKQAFRQYKPLLELEGPVRELKFPPPPPTSHVNRPWASPSAFSGSQQTSNSSCQLKIVRQLQGNLHTIWKQGEQLLIGSGLPLAKMQSNFPSHNNFPPFPPLPHRRGLSSKIKETGFLATHPAKAIYHPGQLDEGLLAEQNSCCRETSTLSSLP